MAGAETRKVRTDTSTIDLFFWKDSNGKLFWVQYSEMSLENKHSTSVIRVLSFWRDVLTPRGAMCCHSLNPLAAAVL